MPQEIPTLLVATDFSAASQVATTYAFHLARALRAHLYLMHVVPENDIQVIRAICEHLESYIAPTTLTDALYADAERRLMALVHEAAVADLVQERLITTGNPVTAICEWAHAKQVQLIVIGTHGHSGIDRLLLGSVAERVLRQAPCSVMVVPCKMLMTKDEKPGE
jgi:nucleotide-binding universal stress UspA family protein